MNFYISEEESSEIGKFTDEHRNKCVKPNPTAIGGAFTYSLTPTSLGTIITVTCGVCGAELDVTNYKDW